MKKLRLFSCKYGHGQPLRLSVRLSESKSKENTLVWGRLTSIEMAGREFKLKFSSGMESNQSIDDLMSGVLDHGNFMPLLDFLIEYPSIVLGPVHGLSYLVAEFVREYR